MKTYDIYAKQDGKWQRKGIQGEPTPPECGGSVEGTAIPVGEKVEKIYFNTALSVEETNAYLSQLTYVDTGITDPCYIVFADSIGSAIGVIKTGKDTYNIIHQSIESDGSMWSTAYYSSLNSEPWMTYSMEMSMSDFSTRIAPFPVIPSALCGKVRSSLADFNGIPVGAENEKIKNVLSITPFGASGGSVDVEDSGLPVEVSTQEEIDALAIGTIFKYTGESGTYENGALYLVEEGE